MKDNRSALTAILLILPICGFAHDENVLSTIFIQFISIVVFIVFLVFLKMNIKRKAVLLIVYFLTAYSIWYFSRDLPYNQNMVLINSAIAFCPALTVGLCFLLIKLTRR